MAASSPALSNNSSDSPAPNTTALSAISASLSTINASKNLRGLNKPKCIKCGNVARSRCPYQSCKSCCAKAQNPCHIHVLKSSSTFPDKGPSSSSPLFDPQSIEAPSSGNSHRVASLRQLSNSFSQFNNLQSPLRSRKPLTRKEATVINEWRLLKLKEFKERNIETEKEAFDRYMQNVNLLEEVFSVNNSTFDGSNLDQSSTAETNHSPINDKDKSMIEGLKLKLRSNPVRTENLRKRMQYIVDQGLRKLKKPESTSEDDELEKKPKKLKSWRAERASALSDLTDKLSKARNEDDLKACLEMKSQIFGSRNRSEPEEETGISKERQCVHYSPLKWFSTASVDQEALDQIDAHFSSLEEIEDL